MMRFRGVLLVLVALAGLSGQAAGQDLSALARLDPAGSGIVQSGGGVAITLALSQPVPWRVRVLDDPPRLVMDFREVDWSGADAITRDAAAVTGLRAGVFRAGWSRLVLELAGPFTVSEAGMQTGTPTRVAVRLDPATPAAFAAAAAVPEPAEWALPQPAKLPEALADEIGRAHV